MAVPDQEDHACDEQQKLEDVFVAAEEQFIEKVEAGEMSLDEYKDVLKTHHQLLVSNVIAKHSLVAPSTEDKTSETNTPTESSKSMSLSSSIVLVPTDGGDESFAAAVRRLSMLPSDPKTEENNIDDKLAISAVHAAIASWDAVPQRRGPLTDLVSTGAIPRPYLLATWCRLAGAERARTGGLSLSELVDIADGNKSTNDIAVNLDAQTKHRIRKDLHRTCCNDEFTSSLDQSEDGELYRLLAAYVSIDPDVGYVQGMNYVAAMCLTATHHAKPLNSEVVADDLYYAAISSTDVEDVVGKKRKLATADSEAAFLLFVRLMQGTGLRRLYDRSDDHLHELILRLDWHIRGCLPALHAHLESEEVGATLFAVEWLTTLFVYNVTYDNAAIIFSLIMVEGGLGFIVQLGVALLAHLEQEMLGQRFDTLLIWLKQRLKSMSTAELLAASRQLGRRVRHVRDYTTTPIATAGTAADMTAAVGEEEVSGMGGLGGRNFQGFTVGGGLGGGHGLGGLDQLGLLAGLQGDSREAWRRLRRPRWMPDEEVAQCHSTSCSRRFSALSQRKHHCRSCGCVFCGPCALTRSSLPHLGYLDMVRVCNFCAASGALVPAQRCLLTPNSSIHSRFVFSCDMPSRSTAELQELRLKNKNSQIEDTVMLPKESAVVGGDVSVGMVLSPIKQWMGRHDIASVTASSAQWLNKLRRPIRDKQAQGDDDDDDELFNEMVDGSFNDFDDDGLFVPRRATVGMAPILPPLPPPSPPPPASSQAPTYTAPPKVRPPPPPVPPPKKAPPPVGARPPPPPAPTSRISISSSPEDLDLFLATAVGSAIISSSPTPAPFFPQNDDPLFGLDEEGSASDGDLATDLEGVDGAVASAWRRSVMYDGQPSSSLFDADDEDGEGLFDIDS